MELRAGYKQTEMGVIPTDWSVATLASLASTAKNSIVGGPFGSDLVSTDYVSSGIPVVRGQNMGQAFLSGDFVFVSKTKAKSLSANLAREGDLIFTQRGTLGQVSVVPSTPFSEYVISQSQMKLSLGSELADRQYIFQYFCSSAGQKQILESAIQTGVPHTNLGILKSYKVTLPANLEEQRAIATALSDVDALLAKIDQLIAKKRDLKQAAMQQLLTGQTRLPGFSGEWDLQSIEQLEQRNVLRLGRGKVISKNDINRLAGENPIYSSSVHNAGLFGKYGDFMFDEEMITWSVDGGGHFFHRPKHKFSVTNVCGYMRLETAILSYKFLALQLQFLHGSMNFDYSSKAHPSVIRKAYIVPLPPLSEQIAIASVLSDMDAELVALEARREKTYALKQGMMQVLLTGHIRLVGGS